MIEHLDVVSYGAVATDALARAVTRAKGDRPLSPVTVVVPTNLAGLGARRRLAFGGDTTRGIANVAFLTPFRLAELLGSDLVLDRRPLTRPALGAAVRAALAAHRGPFSALAHHHATEAALAELHEELTNVSPEALARMEAGGGSLAAASISLHRTIADRLSGFHTEADVARAAARRGDLAARLAPFGHVIWYLPGSFAVPLAIPLAELVGAVLMAAPATVIVAVTGDAGADDAVWRTCRRGRVPRPEVLPPVTPPTADVIVSVTDPEEEVRAVVRRVAALASPEGGNIPLERMGVFYPTADPYATLLGRHLAAAGLPANGPASRQVADMVAGRTLLAALALPARHWRRDLVMALVADAPLRLPPGLRTSAVWERLSRQAGVVAGLDDWRRKLDAAAGALEARARGAVGPDADGVISAAERGRRDVAALRRFVDDLAVAVEAVTRASTWAAKSAAASRLLRHLFGARRDEERWPAAELAAFDRVEDTLTRLGALDEIEPAPSSSTFLRALTAELEAPAGRDGRFGEGVLYGPLAAAAGQALDAVFVVGCTEGRLPVPRRNDPLLSDEARDLAGGELAARAGQLHDQHRAFLAALAAAPAGRRFLTFARGELRGNRRPLPSRWLLDSASALRGAPVHAADFVALGPPTVAVVPSFAAGLMSTVGAAVHADVEERDLATLAAHAAHGGAVAEHPAAAPVRRGLLAQAARRSPVLTEWDGNLAGAPLPPATAGPLAPTTLELWASCGFRFFLHHLLGLRDLDDPVRTVDLVPLDQGNAVHRALEQFLDEVLAEGPPSPDQPWTAAQRERLRVIGESVLDEFHARGRTGRALRWRLVRQGLLDLLDAVLTADDAYRARQRCRPAQAEMAFGFDGEPPVVVYLPDGRAVTFGGRADRVDLTEDGRALVTDYKAGSGTAYGKLDHGDPVRSGTTLQLGVYAEAARQRFGVEHAAAHYWALRAKGGPARYGYDWTDARRDRFLAVIAAVVDGIQAGDFAAVPGEWDSFRRTHTNCVYCPFDRVCPPDRGEHATVKATAGRPHRERLAWEERSS